MPNPSTSETLPWAERITLCGYVLRQRQSRLGALIIEMLTGRPETAVARRADLIALARQQRDELDSLIDQLENPVADKEMRAA